MKRIALLLACLLAPGLLFSQFRTAFGASFDADCAFGRENIGIGGGVSMYFEWMPVLGMIGVSATFAPEGYCVRVTADYRIINEGPDTVKFTLGMGEYFNIYGTESAGADTFYYYNDGSIVRANTFFLGLRAPVGVSFYPEPWLEIYLQAAPALGLELFGDWSFAFEFQGAFGVRFWVGG